MISTAKGMVRREDMRLSEVDQLVVRECFRPGDIIKARVISLGDSRQYYLSTADVELGVILAKCEHSETMLVPRSWKEMENPQTKNRELRKVAKPE